MDSNVDKIMELALATAGDDTARMGLVEWVADDTEECKFCAWPEHSTVVLRIGHTIIVCQEHIWAGLLAKLGPHPRGGELEGIYPEGQE